MPLGKETGPLIRYAGAAADTSIGPKPHGSGLTCIMSCISPLARVARQRQTHFGGAKYAI